MAGKFFQIEIKGVAVISMSRVDFFSEFNKRPGPSIRDSRVLFVVVKLFIHCLCIQGPLNVHIISVVLDLMYYTVSFHILSMTRTKGRFFQKLRSYFCRINSKISPLRTIALALRVISFELAV